MPALNCVCKVCGTAFYRRPSKLLETGNYCSRKCAYSDKDRAERIAYAQRGENHYRYGTGKGRTLNRICIECGTPYYARPSNPNSKYCSEECRDNSEVFARTMRDVNLGEKNPMFGKTPSIETKYKMGLKKTKEQNINWRGGVTPLHSQIRTSSEMSAWKLAVFKADKSTCAYCGEKNTRKLEAHHWTPLNRLLKYHNIQTFEQAKQCLPLWDPENGITLCKTCHDIAHNKKTMRREKQYINTFNAKYKAVV